MSEQRADSALRVTVSGAAGRMGRALVSALDEDDDLSLTGALEAPGNPLEGSDAGAVAGVGVRGVSIDGDLQAALARSDVVVDFTLPEASMALLEACAEVGVRAVVGTTGFSPAQRSRIQELAERTAIVLAPNMSVGVNLCFKLLEIAARTLGDEVDVEIIEAHHRQKLDAPSGTAVRMGELIAEALGRDLAECAVYGREGRTGERDRRTIGFETIRGGDIVGEHTVMFAGLGERVELRHVSTSRANFARGALRAARWVAAQPQGCFDMRDVLGLG